MAKTVVGLFDQYSQAQSAANDLERNGFTHADVSMVAAEQTRDSHHAAGGHTDGTKDNATKTAERAGIGAGVGATAGGLAGLLVGIGALAIPGVGPLVAAGPIVAVLAGAGIGAAAGGLIGALTMLGVPDEHAHYYNEAIQRGGTLVMVRADDARAQLAADVLTRSGAVDVERQSEKWRAEHAMGNTGSALDSATSTRSEAWRAEQANSTTGDGHPDRLGAARSDAWRAEQVNSTTGDGHPDRGQRAIPVMQEDLQVGKREVQGGGVRVYSELVETPVQESVTLREEHVHVERRPVDRPVDPKALDTFREGTIELTERSEQAVIGKTARVVEEVLVGKDVSQRTQVVNETVRRTDVRVEDLEEGTQGLDRQMSFDRLDRDFRTDWETNYRSFGGSYEEMQPAYRYGYDLSNDQRYRGRQWSEVENDARLDWERNRPGTWEKMKNGIRHAWDSVRGQNY